MAHKYVLIAAEIASFAPVEAAELATSDDSGLVTSARAGTVSGRCPGKYALGRAVAARESSLYAALASEFGTERICLPSQAEAEKRQIERVEYHQNPSWRDDDGILRDGARVEKRRYWDDAGRDPAHRAEIRREVLRRCEVVAADPDVRIWRQHGAPKAPTADTLVAGPTTVASDWDRVKARWERLDALLAMLTAPIEVA